MWSRKDDSSSAVYDPESGKKKSGKKKCCIAVCIIISILVLLAVPVAVYAGLGYMAVKNSEWEVPTCNVVHENTFINKPRLRHLHKTRILKNGKAVLTFLFVLYRVSFIFLISTKHAGLRKAR